VFPPGVAPVEPPEKELVPPVKLPPPVPVKEPLPNELDDDPLLLPKLLLLPEAPDMLDVWADA
jgi:hypothetical protein